MLSKKNTERTRTNVVAGKWGYTSFTKAGIDLEFSMGTAEFDLQEFLDNVVSPEHKEKLIDLIEDYLSERSIDEARSNDESGSI